MNTHTDNPPCAGISAPPRVVDTIDSLTVVPPDTPGGEYLIRAVLLGRDGEIAVDLRAADVMSYGATRRAVLERTGVLYRAEIYEGRDAAAMWSETVEHLMGEEVAR